MTVGVLVNGKGALDYIQLHLYVCIFTKDRTYNSNLSEILLNATGQYTFAV